MNTTVFDLPAEPPYPATTDMRQTALHLFEAGVEQADPAHAVETALAGRRFNTPLVIAIGKAARAMAEAAMRIVPADMVVVVTNYENASPLNGAEVYAAGHPVPDIQGARAALRVEQVLAHAKGEVLALISGGGSALLPAPVTGVSLDEKAEMNRLLLASGADIVTMNLVRQHLSRLKGGGILRAAYPSKVTTFVLSDVVSDDFRAIASGPTVSPIGTSQEAVAALKDIDIWDRLPESVRTHLLQDLPDMGELPEGEIELIGSNTHSVAVMARAAGGGVTHGVHVFPSPLEGDVAHAAEVIVDCVTQKGVYLFGGETTVKIKGDGLGGRNQELALRVAQLAAARGITDYVFLSGGTDGRDGPTDAAGGIVDDGTLARMAAAGVDLDDILARNDSYHGLAAAGDLLKTGPTGTNVADLQVFIKA